jgi:hypothetical protein
MEIYVQSRGYSPNVEYCWQPEVPPHLNKISGLIQSESPSVVVGRFDKELILLVTGLQSFERDFRDRPIRHSIAWICSDNKHDERKIREIAVQALQGLLRDRVNQCIEVGGESGFKLVDRKLQEMTDSFKGEEIEERDLKDLEKSRKIGKNSQELRDDLKNELQKYSLPKEYEIIVVSTGIKSEESLKKAGIWRSLSSLVKSDEWRDLSSSEVKKSNFSLVAIAIIVIVTIVMMIVLMQSNLKPPTLTPPVNQELKKNSLSSASKKGLMSPEKDSLLFVLPEKKSMMLPEKESIEKTPPIQHPVTIKTKKQMTKTNDVVEIINPND